MLQTYAKFWRVSKNWHGHFQRDPLTSDLKICECKWVLWVPTSLPFTDMPTL